MAYAVLSIIVFVLRTAGPAVYIDTMGKYTITLNGINFEHNANASVERAELQAWFNKQCDLNAKIDYMFSSFIVLTGVMVVMLTIQLWRAHRAVGIRDKVFIVPMHNGSVIEADTLDHLIANQ